MESRARFLAHPFTSCIAFDAEQEWTSLSGVLHSELIKKPATPTAEFQRFMYCFGVARRRSDFFHAAFGQFAKSRYPRCLI